MAGYSIKSKQYRHRLGCFKRGIGENIGEFGAHFIGIELVPNIDNGNGRDRQEQTGLFREFNTSRQEWMRKRTHNINTVFKAS